MSAEFAGFLMENIWERHAEHFRSENDAHLYVENLYRTLKRQIGFESESAFQVYLHRPKVSEWAVVRTLPPAPGESPAFPENKRDNVQLQRYVYKDPRTDGMLFTGEFYMGYSAKVDTIVLFWETPARKD
jgi:hypothetical protein